MKPAFQMMAQYNRWANTRLYKAVSVVAEADYFADRKAFFGSLHGTLNHLLVGDRIWMQRFTGQGEAPSALDALLFSDFVSLRKARDIEDARIQRFADALTPEQLAGSFRYTTVMRPQTVEQPLASALMHFFNHQTHHRGQAHCLLTQLDIVAPSLDLILYQRETGIGIETNLMRT